MVDGGDRAGQAKSLRRPKTATDNREAAIAPHPYRFFEPRLVPVAQRSVCSEKCLMIVASLPPTGQSGPVEPGTPVEFVEPARQPDARASVDAPNDAAVDLRRDLTDLARDDHLLVPGMQPRCQRAFLE